MVLLMAATAAVAAVAATVTSQSAAWAALPELGYNPAQHRVSRGRRSLRLP
jgi:hypothetical protein